MAFKGKAGHSPSRPSHSVGHCTGSDAAGDVTDSPDNALGVVSGVGPGGQKNRLFHPLSALAVGLKSIGLKRQVGSWTSLDNKR